jgi:hypothetical protein
MDGLAESLGRSPELFPHDLDPKTDAVSLIRLTRADYEKASFLDQRVLTPRTIGRQIVWRALATAIEGAKLPERCGYIFHIGHVGSTLLSRLLGSHPTLFALREPLLLRTFAQARTDPETLARVWSAGEYEARLTGGLRLLSRTFDPDQTAIVKATSFVSELAGELVSRPSAPKAVTMFVPAETYIAAILGGPNSRQEARHFTLGRLKRLNRKVGRDAWRLAALSEGEALALSWACEMSSLAGAARVGGSRIMRLDFDQFLIDPPQHLASAFRHFDVAVSDRDLQAIVNGPEMKRYSKAQEHAYDTALRNEVLNNARRRFATEIARGLAWLERSAGEFPAIRDAVEFAAISAT